MGPWLLSLTRTVSDANVLHFIYTVDRLVAQGHHGFAAMVEVVAISDLLSSDDDTGHDSVCVSVSPGCYRTPGCRYCATGMTSERQNVPATELQVGEITNQVVLSLQNIRNQWPNFGKRSLSLSFMGKGEPGLYPTTVMETIRELYLKGTIHRSSLATTGLPRYFKGLSKAYRAVGGDFPAPLLQVSIHAPFDADRTALVTNDSALAPIRDVLCSAIEDYALSILPRGTFITVRLNLMGWNGGKTNYGAASLDEMARLVKEYTRRYEHRAFGGLVVVVALLNETGAIEEQCIRSGSPEDLRRVIAGLKDRGVAARELAGARVKTSVGACGTLSCDLRMAPRKA